MLLLEYMHLLVGSLVYCEGVQYQMELDSVWRTYGPLQNSNIAVEFIQFPCKLLNGGYYTVWKLFPCPFWFQQQPLNALWHVTTLVRSKRHI